MLILEMKIGWKPDPDVIDGLTSAEDGDYVSEIEMLRELIVHCWIHIGYRDCGFEQMTTEQKVLYRAITSAPGVFS